MLSPRVRSSAAAAGKDQCPWLEVAVTNRKGQASTGIQAARWKAAAVKVYKLKKERRVGAVKKWEYLFERACQLKRERDEKRNAGVSSVGRSVLGASQFRKAAVLITIWVLLTQVFTFPRGSEAS